MAIEYSMPIVRHIGFALHQMWAPHYSMGGGAFIG